MRSSDESSHAVTGSDEMTLVPVPQDLLSLLAGRTPGVRPAQAVEQALRVFLAGDPRPIGVLDSGVGGLTVMRAIEHRLPHESLIYIGDEAHFPYGPRPQHEVRDFAFELIRELEKRGVKLVVIACNTATAAALREARDEFELPIIGVIAPAARTAAQVTRRGRVGVIATEGTCASLEYPHAIREVNPRAVVRQRACPELVELVEEGLADSRRAEEALRTDLAEIVAWGADVLVLGCTHYPVLRPAIERVFPHTFTLIDSGDEVARVVHQWLRDERLEAGRTSGAQAEILVTGQRERFARVAATILGGPQPEVREIDLALTPQPSR